MGIAGTEVAKEASRIIIMDDQFSSIVDSVRWGRSIKENIRKFLAFQLTINCVALTLTFVTACANNGSTDKFPITPVQLLWVNLIMDSFAALALATEPPSDHLLQYPPQGSAERLLTRTMLKNILGHAVFQTALLLWLTMAPAGSALFGIPAAGHGGVQHYTAVFTSFVALQIFNLFNCRTIHDEWNVLEGFGASTVGQIIVVIIVVMQVLMVQFGGSFTQTEPLSQVQWGQCVLLGAASIPVGYLLKLVPEGGRQLRRLGPGGSALEPQGVLYAETPGMRSSVLRTLTHSRVAAAAAGGGDGSDMLRQGAKVEASALAASEERMRDSALHGGDGEEPLSPLAGGAEATAVAAQASMLRQRTARRGAVGSAEKRRPSVSSADASGVDADSLSSLVAGGPAAASAAGSAGGRVTRSRKSAASPTGRR